jgi:hypothetical protein
LGVNKSNWWIIVHCLSKKLKSHESIYFKKQIPISIANKFDLGTQEHPKNNNKTKNECSVKLI